MLRMNNLSVPLDINKSGRKRSLSLYFCGAGILCEEGMQVVLTMLRPALFFGALSALSGFIDCISLLAL